MLHLLGLTTETRKEIFGALLALPHCFGVPGSVWPSGLAWDARALPAWSTECTLQGRDLPGSNLNIDQSQEPGDNWCL